MFHSFNGADRRRALVHAFAIAIGNVASLGAQNSSIISDARWGWRNIGPARMGGIVNDIAVPVPRSPADPRAGTIMYVAAPGGLFKTADAGETWASLLDGQTVNVVHRVALAPSNQKVVWVATGDATGYWDPQPGIGVLRSTDGGATWMRAGLEPAEFIQPNCGPRVGWSSSRH
jgi:hypothetical protein